MKQLLITGQGKKVVVIDLDMRKPGAIVVNNFRHIFFSRNSN